MNKGRWMKPGLIPAALGLAGLALPIAAQRDAPPVAFDCTAGNARCSLMEFKGDAADRSGFHGMGDPSIRLDPNSGTLYMSYSWPRHLRDSSTNVVEIHLSKSTDKGKTWTYVGPLFKTREIKNSQSSRYAENNYLSHEVVDLLPVNHNGVTTWYSVRLDYLVASGERFPYKEILPTSYLAVSTVPATEQLPQIGSSPEAHLGHAATDPALAVNLNLANLDPSIASCRFFNEPALAYRDGTLYMAVQCIVGGRASAMRANASRSKYPAPYFMMLSTKPEGEPAAWKWKYVGAFATPDEAHALGVAEGGNYTYFTQLELVNRADGTPLALLTPANSAPAPAGMGKAAQQLHYGCRAIQLNPNLTSPSLVKDASGAPRVLAKVTASDLYTGTNIGTGSCSYDPASATGIVIARKLMRDPTLGFYSTLFRTGIHP